MIEVKDIVKRYGDHTAVDHLSFTLEKGKIYGFLGPNGAGKSTTMNIMTGYIAASEGTVTINGLDIVKEPEEAKKSIGYLPELPPLYQDMTVLEYLTFVAELKRVPKRERRDQLARVLSMTVLGDYQNRLIRNLSKGYKQRVGLAQALIGFPEIIILDEPTVGLDPQQILEIRDLIRSLKEEHIVMLSSHILSEVNEVCDEVMILSHGKLVANGTPEELESMIQKNATLKLSVLGGEEAVRSALADTEHVTELIFGELQADGALPVTVETDSNEDIRAEIARALATAGLPVMAMSIETHSLEEVFLELTGAEAETAVGEAAGSAPEGTAEAAGTTADDAEADVTAEGDGMFAGDAEETAGEAEATGEAASEDAVGSADEGSPAADETGAAEPAGAAEASTEADGGSAVEEPAEESGTEGQRDEDPGEEAKREEAAQ